MIDFKKEIDKITKLKTPEDVNKGLEELPEVLFIGKKIKIGKKTITYSYTEKEREIMKHMYSLDIEKEMEKKLYGEFLLGI